VYTQWSAFGPCTQSCGKGFKYRTKINTCTKKVEYESATCGEDNYSQWSDFSQCSVSCGDGVKTRTRSNACSMGEIESQTVKCSNGVCSKNCGVRWLDWTDCNDKCQGERVRRLVSSCYGNVVMEQKQDCSEINTSKWTNWTSWSSCSSSCYSGIQKRSRKQICPVQTQHQTQNCGSGAGWSEYSNWSVCSVSCGQGIRKRIRTHPCPDDVVGSDTEDQTEICRVECKTTLDVQALPSVISFHPKIDDVIAGHHHGDGSGHHHGDELGHSGNDGGFGAAEKNLGSKVQDKDVQDVLKIIQAQLVG